MNRSITNNIIALNILKNLFPILLIVLASCITISCEEVKGEPVEFPVKNKTVLVYMVGNNNLSGTAEINLADMQKGYIPDFDEGNIIAYYHILNQTPLLLNIHKDETGQVAVDTAYRFPARNSAKPESLKSALQVTQTMFPANEYGLILWSHGTGWLPVGYYDKTPFSLETAYANIWQKYTDGIDPFAHLVKMVKSPYGKTRSFGSEEGVEMNITDLAKALPYKLSFIIFDACLMGGIETAYELKEYTDHLIFSPAEVLAEGFPYSKIMQHIFSNPTDLESVAKEYYNHYNNLTGYNRSATVSLVKCSELENVAAVAKSVFDTYHDNIQLLDMNSIQQYFRMNKHWFYDIEDFINNIAPAEQATAFKQALEKAVVYKASTPYFIDIPIRRYSGISTYIPNPANEELDSFYKNLAWNKASGMVK